MTDNLYYTLGPDHAVQFGEFWSARVDALEHHLSAKTWAVAAVTVLLIAYPIARIMIPVVISGTVPDVVRTVLHWM